MGRNLREKNMELQIDTLKKDIRRYKRVIKKIGELAASKGPREILLTGILELVSEGK